MTKQHLPREASPRAFEGSSALSPDTRGRASAPRVVDRFPRGIWLPVVIKIVLALGAAFVLAQIATRAGSASPAQGVEPLASSSSAPLATTPPAAASSPPATERVSASAEPARVDPSIEGRGGSLADGRVVLNAASEVELMKIPGIGPSRARAILALKQRLAKFRSVEELLRVKGIGRKTLRRIQPLVVVDVPRSSDAGSATAP
jgi:competence ComEA-like helix-hairpin-helix protein